MSGRLEVPIVSDLDLAFPARALDWMPEWDEIPAEFKSQSGNEWTRLADRWFASGLPGDTTFHPSEGVDAANAMRACKATLGSFAPSHEHKIAAVAFMLSTWFERVTPGGET